MKGPPDALHMLNRIGGEDQNSSHAMSLSTNNLRPLRNHCNFPAKSVHF